MQKTFTLKGISSLCVILILSVTKLPAQHVSATSAISTPDITNRYNYSLKTNLPTVNGFVFFSCLQLAGKSDCLKYGNAIAIEKKLCNIKVITINPSPVSNEMAPSGSMYHYPAE